MLTPVDPQASLHAQDELIPKSGNKVLTPAHVQASPHSTLFKAPTVNLLPPDLRAPASASTFRAGAIGPSLRVFTSSRLSAYP